MRGCNEHSKHVNNRLKKNRGIFRSAFEENVKWVKKLVLITAIFISADKNSRERGSKKFRGRGQMRFLVTLILNL